MNVIVKGTVSLIIVRQLLKNSHPPFHRTRKWLKKQPTSMNELAIAYSLAGISVVNNGTKTKRLYDYGVQVL